jgi:hypothetical protein
MATLLECIAVFEADRAYVRPMLAELAGAAPAHQEV